MRALQAAGRARTPNDYIWYYYVKHAHVWFAWQPQQKEKHGWTRRIIIYSKGIVCHVPIRSNAVFSVCMHVPQYNYLIPTNYVLVQSSACFSCGSELQPCTALILPRKLIPTIRLLNCVLCTVLARIVPIYTHRTHDGQIVCGHIRLWFLQAWPPPFPLTSPTPRLRPSCNPSSTRPNTSMTRSPRSRSRPCRPGH